MSKRSRKGAKASGVRAILPKTLSKSPIFFPKACSAATNAATAVCRLFNLGVGAHTIPPAVPMAGAIVAAAAAAAAAAVGIGSVRGPATH